MDPAHSLSRSKRQRSEKATAVGPEIGDCHALRPGAGSRKRLKVIDGGSNTEVHEFNKPLATRPLPGVTKSNMPAARRRLVFGREVKIQQNVVDVYKLVRKLTGTIGGNGSFGAIYGELTMGSMQKIINLMKKHTCFNKDSKFIDVGSGIGKPNLHVCQDPGVEFSYGIEMERSRWVLSLASLKATLDAAQAQRSGTEAFQNDLKIGSSCYFDHGNIMSAKTFQPFTHVYMFSIGFPPDLWKHLAKIWNRSTSPYLICYHPPKTLIDQHDFDLELITAAKTWMHGSGESHKGYIYKRKRTVLPSDPNESDPLYEKAFRKVTAGFHTLHQDVSAALQNSIFGKMVTRSRKVTHSM